MKQSGIAAALLCGLLGFGASIAATGEDLPTAPSVGEVTPIPSYGLEFCQQFAARVESTARQKPDRSADVAELIREGEAQCAAGHIKSGLHRLRIALVALEHELFDHAPLEQR